MRRIEVIRGPSSVLYGNAAGGVISLVTEIDTTRRLTIRPDLQWGSHGYRRQQFRVDGRNGRGTRFMGSVSRFRADGWRNHSQAEVRQANVVVRQTLPTGTERSLVFNHYHLPFAANPSYLSAVEAGDPRLTAAERGGRVQDPRQARPFQGTTVAEQNWGESAVQMQGGATLEHRFSGAQVLRATVWAARRRVDTALVIRALDLRRLGAGLRSEYQGAVEVGSTTLEWTAGVDVSSKDETRLDCHFLPPFVVGATAHRGPLNLDQQELVSSAAPFGQLGVSPHPRVTLTAGARYDHYRFRAVDRKLDDGDQSGRRTMSAHSPTFGMTWRWRRASTSTATSRPTVHACWTGWCRSIPAVSRSITRTPAKPHATASSCRSAGGRRPASRPGSPTPSRTSSSAGSCSTGSTTPGRASRGRRRAACSRASTTRRRSDCRRARRCGGSTSTSSRILVLVLFGSGGNDTPRVRYVRRPFQREPDFGAASVNYALKDLLATAEDPRQGGRQVPTTGRPPERS